MLHDELVAVSAVGEGPGMAEAFATLAVWWGRETMYFSSPTAMYEHPAMRAIIAMGPGVVPLILAELRREIGHWYGALRQLTGIEAALGEETMEGARQAWLDWGAEHGRIAWDGEA
jgi:hypothetical protein